MKKSLLYGLPAAICLLLFAVVGRGATPFAVVILDDETGQPTAATVVLTDDKDRALRPDGNPGKIPYLGKTRYYVDGMFTLANPPRTLRIEARRGFETLPTVQTITISKNDRKATVRLRRFIDMRKHGYLNGDTHVHFLSPADSHLQLRAEGLDVLNLLTSDFTDDVEKFSGALDKVSSDHAWVYVGQEVRDWQNGHVILMGIRKLFEPVGPGGGSFRDNVAPNRLMLPALRAARAQDAVTSWAHFTNLPGIESPIDAALGLLDAIDLATNNDPTGLPSHWAPWKESGFSQAEFTIMRGVDLYYQFLNSGLRIPLGAGSDKMGEDVPVGNNRFYGRIEGAPSYAAWLAAFKAGRGFITNHPMLFFEVDGQQTGDVVNFKGTRRVHAKVKAQSLLPFINLEIVVNGNEVLTKSTYPWQSKAVDGLYTYEAEVTVDLKESSWIAARAAAHPDFREAILPRDLTVFAHANPIYFLKDGKPVRVPASRRYLTKYVDGAIHWFETGAKFATAAEKQEALAAARQARKFYTER